MMRGQSTTHGIVVIASKMSVGVFKVFQSASTAIPTNSNANIEMMSDGMNQWYVLNLPDRI
jgi:hypothetical protein